MQTFCKQAQPSYAEPVILKSRLVRPRLYEQCHASSTHAVQLQAPFDGTT